MCFFNNRETTEKVNPEVRNIYGKEFISLRFTI